MAIVNISKEEAKKINIAMTGSIAESSALKSSGQMCSNREKNYGSELHLINVIMGKMEKIINET